MKLEGGSNGGTSTRAPAGSLSHRLRVLVSKAPDDSPAPPYAHDPQFIRRAGRLTALALAPCMIAAVYFFSLRVAAMIAVSYAAVLAVEIVFALLRSRPLRAGGFPAALLLALILPPALPMWIVAVGAAFGATIQELFGGVGRSPFHPAVIGRCFLTLSYPAAMSAGWIVPAVAWPGRLGQYVHAATADAVTSATPLLESRNGQLADLADLAWGAVAGSSGETCAAAIILGGLVLIVLRAADWRTPASMLGSFLLLALALHAADPARFGDPLWQLCAGGVLFGAFFLAVDPVTGPTTRGGKWVCGAIVGSSALVIRCFGSYRDGVAFAILLGSIVAPLVDAGFVTLRKRQAGQEVAA